MMENEDSVVTSLNELRKLKNERITRQTQSRSSVAPSRVSALAEDPVADQLTPPPVQGPALSAMRKSAAFDPGANFESSGRGGFSHSPIAYDPAPAQVLVRPRSSVKAAVFVAVLFAGAGGAGYVKLQNDTQALLAAKDATIRQSEEARNRAVEMGAKADQVAKNNLRQCEEKLKGTMAMAPAVAPIAPSAAAPSAPVVQKAERPSVAARAAAHTNAHKASARPSRHASAQAEPAAPKSADVPAIAKKKKVELDPLAGLGKL
jgi:hypothetical protein